MPYIKNRWTRWDIEDPNSHPKTPGELNYLLTIIANEYWKTERDYRAINDVVGALEGAKLEFYRRVAAPYEDKKMEANGDVYDVG
jgi:hypothetical protein